MDGSSRSTQSGGPRTQSGLACNICLLRMPNSPVAACCGHVFCWSCLYRSWTQQGPGVQSGPAITKSCPVCGMALREGFNIVPIYGYDNVASPTATTTTAAATAPDTTTSPRPTAAVTAPVSSTPIPPRPTAASFFTGTPRCPHLVLPEPARTAAALNTARLAAIAAAVSSDTDIPPRPNPPARITQTQTDAALGQYNVSSTITRHGNVGHSFGFGAGDRLRPSASSSAARNISLGIISRAIRRRRNYLRLNPGGMDGNDGNSESHRMDRLDELLDDLEAAITRVSALNDARDEVEDALNRATAT